MAHWYWIIALSGSATLLSTSGAALLAALGERNLKRLLPALVSFSTGVMLGAACLDLLPQAFAETTPEMASRLGVALAAGILLFFILEKLIHWHHSHDVPHDMRPHSANNRGTTIMVLTGTSMHNLLAGILLAAAVLVSIKGALILFAAILAHHLPQQVGDFSILMVAGYKRWRALALTFLSSLAIFVGGILAFIILQHSQAALPYIMIIAAASLIYISLADLIPRLRSSANHHFVTTVILVACGIGLVFLVVHLLPS